MNNRYSKFLLLLFICCVALQGCKPSAKHRLPDNPYADGLLRSAPESQRVYSENIIQFLEEIKAAQLELHSFMFVRHGRVVAEGWWYPYRPKVNHVMHSVSKTVTATAIGFAVQEKLLTVEDKVVSFFPDEKPETVSPYWEELRVKHLLSMSVGQEQAPHYAVSDDNWVKRFLAEPIENEPGTSFRYNSMASYMLSAILQKVSGETVYEFLVPRFFEPLGINDIQWETNREGVTAGGWGLRMKTADLAKLGMFYLQKGNWNGQQLLTESWFTEATSPQVYQYPDRTAEENAGDDWAQGYGYQLWICTNNAYRFDGAYGQLAVVMPEQDAVVAVTARTSETKQVLQLIWDKLVPSMTDRKLDTDEDTNEMLYSQLSSLQLPLPFRSDDKLTKPKNESRSYRVEQENPLGIKGIGFRFESNANCQLTLTTGEASYELAFALDSWQSGKTEKLSSYFLSKNPEGMLPLDVAGYCSWTRENVLQLRLLYLNDAQDETYTCIFSGDKVSIEVVNSSQKEAVKLTGIL